MGKLRYAVIGISVIAVFSALHSEQIIAESNVFSFPEMVPVKMNRIAVEKPYFRHGSLNPYSRSVTFSWRLPDAAAETQGAIVIYSLLGRVVDRIAVNKATGTAAWNFRASSKRSGIYLAQITLGGQVRNLKLMLWN